MVLLGITSCTYNEANDILISCKFIEMIMPTVLFLQEKEKMLFSVLNLQMMWSPEILPSTERNTRFLQRIQKFQNSTKKLSKEMWTQFIAIVFQSPSSRKRSVSHLCLILYDDLQLPVDLHSVWCQIFLQPISCDLSFPLSCLLESLDTLPDHH